MNTRITYGSKRADGQEVETSLILEGFDLGGLVLIGECLVNGDFIPTQVGLPAPGGAGPRTPGPDDVWHEWRTPAATREPSSHPMSMAALVCEFDNLYEWDEDTALTTLLPRRHLAQVSPAVGSGVDGSPRRLRARDLLRDSRRRRP
ncbi:hypothetical protein [Miltoncostaea oceani]|uniref:hypothetical protein n=1 Tax=Miltoncostaea oceani TaxID=2843216 RepID=UPI001C3E3CEB|nr:hypothetical protein [Miltoncostaea oceani]